MPKFDYLILNWFLFALIGVKTSFVSKGALILACAVFFLRFSGIKVKKNFDLTNRTFFSSPDATLALVLGLAIA
jgi:hypothetical protein